MSTASSLKSTDRSLARTSITHESARQTHQSFLKVWPYVRGGDFSSISVMLPYRRTSHADVRAPKVAARTPQLSVRRIPKPSRSRRRLSPLGRSGHDRPRVCDVRHGRARLLCGSLSRQAKPPLGRPNGMDYQRCFVQHGFPARYWLSKQNVVYPRNCCPLSVWPYLYEAQTSSLAIPPTKTCRPD